MRALLAALLLLASPVLAACARPAETEPALWRIADADSEIWLFGTAHMLPPGLRWRGPRVNAAFAAADELVTETDTSAEANAELQALSQQLGAAGEDAPLSGQLAPEDRARLSAVAESLRMDARGLERMRPWLAALQLSYAYALSRGMRPEAGVETVLSAEARRRCMRLSFFETPEQQMRFLADLPAAEQTRFLADTLREIESDSAMLEDVDVLWARGDTQALARLFDAQWQAGSPAVHEAIILQRNRAWADEIARRLDGEGRVFIAVGAAHLVGEGNVIALLRDRGIAVEGP
jgi:uncharacterized protein YbaP (TraB family)